MVRRIRQRREINKKKEGSCEGHDFILSEDTGTYKKKLTAHNIFHFVRHIVSVRLTFPHTRTNLKIVLPKNSKRIVIIMKIAGRAGKRIGERKKDKEIGKR